GQDDPQRRALPRRNRRGQDRDLGCLFAAGGTLRPQIRCRDKSQDKCQDKCAGQRQQRCRGSSRMARWKQLDPLVVPRPQLKPSSAKLWLNHGKNPPPRKARSAASLTCNRTNHFRSLSEHLSDPCGVSADGRGSVQWPGPPQWPFCEAENFMLRGRVSFRAGPARFTLPPMLYSLRAEASTNATTSQWVRR